MSTPAAFSLDSKSASSLSSGDLGSLKTDPGTGNDSTGGSRVFLMTSRGLFIPRVAGFGKIEGFLISAKIRNN